MSYSFRIHGYMGDLARINVAARRQVVWSDGVATVAIRSTPDDQNIADTGDLIIEGTGWPSEQAAAEAGDLWRSAILFGFAHRAIAISLGAREKAWSRMGPGAEQHVRELFNLDPAVRIQDDQPGVVTYEPEPPIKFVRLTASAHKSPNTEYLIESVLLARDTGERASPKQLLAFELLNTSLSLTAPDVRFVTLMMAIECLLEFVPRPDEMQTIVNEAIAKATELEAGPARESLVGSLRYLLNESISSSGQRLVHNLDDRIRYQGLAPDIFFKKCYGIRSLLVHGSSDTPTPEEVDEIAASLEVMVSDLLSVPTLGFQSHREP